MPSTNDDLFHRLRRVGVRKQVAKTLSELSEDASKKAINAGHRAVAELRVLADEIEKRLPAPESEASITAQPTPVISARPSTPAKTTQPKAQKKATPAPSKPAAKRKAAAGSPTPRGENKAKILAVLKSGPRTASEIGQEAGIATATVSASLTRMSKTGEVTKAERGYALPSS